MCIPGKVALEGVETRTAVAQYPGVFQGVATVQIDAEGAQVCGSLMCSGYKCPIVGWRGKRSCP